MQTLDLVDAETGVDFCHGIHLDVRSVGEGGQVALVLPGAERVAEDSGFVAELARDFTVVVPSHPGFGRSPRPDWIRSVDDLAYLYLDWLDRSGWTDVTLIGLQFGGWVAMEMAIRNSTRIANLVLVDSLGVKLGGPLDRDIIDVFAAPRTEVEALMYADPSVGLGDFSQALDEDLLELARNDEALVMYGWQPYMHNPALRHWLRRITVPTLVVWGGQDRIVSPTYGRALADLIPNASFEQIDRAGHRAQVECPADLAELIRTAV